MNGLKPFATLASPREVNRPELPQELVQFYTANEAVEFEGTEEYGSMYLHPLHEVKRVGWADFFDAGSCPDVWKGFDGFRIGCGCYFDEIVYAVEAPCCQPEAILTFGGTMPEGGTGSHGALCMVLAPSFSEWLGRLEQEGWWEYILGGGMAELPRQHQLQLRAYYLALNPNMDWPEPQ